MTRQRYPRSTCAFPGCTRWSTLYPPGCPWLCGPRGCWIKIAPSSRRLLRKCWRRMRAIWPEGTPWAMLPPDQRVDYLRIRRAEERIWKRAIERAVFREAGL